MTLKLYTHVKETDTYLYLYSRVKDTTTNIEGTIRYIRTFGDTTIIKIKFDGESRMRGYLGKSQSKLESL